MNTAAQFTLSSGTVHMAIDMQRVFAEETEWRMQDFHAIVPNIIALAKALPGRTLFTRFVTPHVAEDARGHWQHYYRRWSQFTASQIKPGLVDIVSALEPYVDEFNVLDKPTYSAFEVPECEKWLSARGADTILFSGVETDVCVLASLLAAIDRGYRVVAVSDALGSSSREGHEATLLKILTRMPDQVEIVDTRTVLACLADKSPKLG